MGFNEPTKPNIFNMNWDALPFGDTAEEQAKNAMKHIEQIKTYFKKMGLEVSSDGSQRSTYIIGKGETDAEKLVFQANIFYSSSFKCRFTFNLDVTKVYPDTYFGYHAISKLEKYYKKEVA